MEFQKNDCSKLKKNLENNKGKLIFQSVTCVFTSLILPACWFYRPFILYPLVWCWPWVLSKLFFSVLNLFIAMAKLVFVFFTFHIFNLWTMKKVILWKLVCFFLIFPLEIYVISHYTLSNQIFRSLKWFLALV